MTKIDTVEECNTSSESSLDSLAADFRILVLALSEKIAERDYEGIALEMGFVQATRVSRGDVFRISQSPNVQHRSDDELRIFRATDVVSQTVDDAGRKSYILVEACVTVDKRVTDRALRNAEILTEATTIPARAAVCGRDIASDAESVIASGDIHWHQFGSKDFAPR